MRKQHPDLFLAHADQPLLMVVVGLHFVTQMLDLDHVFEVADLRRTIRQMQPLRFSVFLDLDFHPGQHVGVVLFAQHDVHGLAGQPVPRELVFEVHHVVDEHNLVDQQVSQFQIAYRLFAANRDGEHRDSFAPSIVGRVAKALAVRVDPIGEHHHRRWRSASQIAQHAAQSRAQAAAFAAWFQTPNRVAHLGQRTGNRPRSARYKVQLQPIALFDGRENVVSRLQEHGFGQVQSALLVDTRRLQSAGGQRLLFLVVVMVVDSHARRIVDHDGHCGKPRAP